MVAADDPGDGHRAGELAASSAAPAAIRPPTSDLYHSNEKPFPKFVDTIKWRWNSALAKEINFPIVVTRKLKAPDLRGNPFLDLSNGQLI